MGDFTCLLDAISAGDRDAVGQVIAMVYPELRNMAHRRLRKSSRDAILDTTSLVHECYLKFARLGRLKIEDRSHFLAYAARVMRSIVVDFARERLALCNGAGAKPITLPTEVLDTDESNARALLDIEEALESIGKVDPRLVQVVEMRYFAGYSTQEIARSLCVTERTVRRDWEKARLLLLDTLRT